MNPPFETATTPHNGWNWQDGEGFKVHGDNFNVFMDKIYDRKLATGAFVGAHWQHEVYDYLCANQGIPCRSADNPPERTLETKVQDMRQFGHVVLRWIESGGQFVPQEEAERRATICAQCPKNVSVGGLCAACGRLIPFLSGLATGRRTSKDSLLTQCEVCSCFLQTAVHVPLNAQKDERFGKGDFPDPCWKRDCY